MLVIHRPRVFQGLPESAAPYHTPSTDSTLEPDAGTCACSEVLQWLQFKDDRKVCNTIYGTFSGHLGG